MSSRRFGIILFYVVMVILTLIDKPEEWFTIIVGSLMLPAVAFWAMWLLGFVLSKTE